MRLPDSASIFTAEMWTIIKVLEEIKNASASKFIFFMGKRFSLFVSSSSSYYYYIFLIIIIVAVLV